jgi:hypothetical protein
LISEDVIGTAALPTAAHTIAYNVGWRPYFCTEEKSYDSIELKSEQK